MHTFQVFHDKVFIGETKPFKITEALSHEVNAQRDSIVETIPFMERVNRIEFKAVKVK